MNPVHKNVNDSLMYEKSLKFCVLGILSFNLTKCFWVIMDGTRIIYKNNNAPFSLLLKMKLCNTLITNFPHSTSSDVMGSTDEKTDRSLYCQLAGHTCGYVPQCASRQSQYIGLDSVIHKY